MKNEVISSPIRWAGSKKKILNEMLTLFFDKTEYYVEPFLGSGVVLINLMNNIEVFEYKKIYVNDINSNIINFFLMLRDKCELLNDKIQGILKEYNNLSNMKDKELFYYKIREKYNGMQNTNQEKAIYFFFLMKAGYNGVYRENKSGKFNVPFGKKEKLNCDEQNLIRISKLIKNVIFYNENYEDFLKCLDKQNILKNAFVYFDPPYIPEEKVLNKNQELYTNKSFEHKKFINRIEKMKINKFLISMSDSKEADLVYGSYQKSKINEIVRTINPKKTIKSTEVVYSNYKIYK